MVVDPSVVFEQARAEMLLGHFDRAQQMASAEESKLLVRDPAWSYKFCLLQAEILELQGRNKDVIDIIQSQNFAPEGDLAVKQKMLLSYSDARLGHLQKSIEELNAAQQLSKTTNSPLEGEVLRTQGLLEYMNGNPSDAERDIRKSRDFARLLKDNYLEASDDLNLGYFAEEAEHIDESLDYFRTSAAMAKQAHVDLLLQMDAGNSAQAYYELGDFENALQSFRDAEQQAQIDGATDSEILWLQDEGLALSRLGETAQARTCYFDALRLAQESNNTAQQAEIEISLSLLNLQWNRLPEANAHANAALSLSRQLDNKPIVLESSFAHALIAARTTKSRDAEHLLLQVLSNATAAPSIRWQAQDALAVVVASQNRSLEAEQWYRKSIQTFEAERKSVHDTEQRLPFLVNGDELYQHYADFLIAAGRTTQALDLLDSERAKSLKEASASTAHQAAYRQSSSYSRPSSVVLFYSLGSERSYVWTIKGQAVHLFMLPPAAEFKAHIESYQSSILKSRDPVQEQNADGEWLYKNLVAPAEASIGAAKNLVIVPDGPLDGFNMETLLKEGPTGLHYWIDDVTITTSTSFRQRSDSSPRATMGPIHKALLLMGDPLLSTADYQILPQARTEIDAVESYFPAPQRTTLTQAAAVPAAYRASHPEQYEYLHFVTHGVAGRLRPLDSAIILSPTSADSGNFKLYARDIIQQPIQARLVTISACYGSGIRSYAGEGLVGLAWAFLRAGAHQVIGALWEVNDSSTPQLMSRMYDEVSRGEQPEQALRTAKLSLLHSRGVFRKPFYWAAFQIYSGS